MLERLRQEYEDSLSDQYDNNDQLLFPTDDEYSDYSYGIYEDIYEHINKFGTIPLEKE